MRNLVLGLLFGTLFATLFFTHELNQLNYQYQQTIRAWMKDRRDWSYGKPFEYNYGQHHERW